MPTIPQEGPDWYTILSLPVSGSGAHINVLVDVDITVDVYCPTLILSSSGAVQPMNVIIDSEDSFTVNAMY